MVLTVGTPQSLPVPLNLRIRQGSDVTWAVRYSETASNVTVPNTFTGWTARAQIRQRVGGEVWLNMTSVDAITLMPLANKLTVTGLIAHTVTESVEWNARTLGVWDVELVRADGAVIPLAAGSVYVSPDVTRS